MYIKLFDLSLYPFLLIKLMLFNQDEQYCPFQENCKYRDADHLPTERVDILIFNDDGRGYICSNQSHKPSISRVHAGCSYLETINRVYEMHKIITEKLGSDDVAKILRKKCVTQGDPRL